ncbi:MAG: hypothetical protein OXC14_21435 [Rhodospirillaceae bacterium]|nr:hypothetical protein [Rhodospirillaceae bacterium]
MAQTQQENIRFTAEQWEPIENAGRAREVSPNQLVADLALEALDRRSPLTAATDLKTPSTGIPSLSILPPRPASLLPKPRNP